MRLRPFGDSGRLVASFASFEDLTCSRHGRDWERYAYVRERERSRLRVRIYTPKSTLPR